jgi:hypothetical protein
MKNLEDAQREMRERNARKKREENLVQRKLPLRMTVLRCFG